MPRRVASGSTQPAKASAPKRVPAGKSAWRTPTPEIWPRDRKVPGPIVFFTFPNPRETRLLTRGHSPLLFCFSLFPRPCIPVKRLAVFVSFLASLSLAHAQTPAAPTAHARTPAAADAPARKPAAPAISLWKALRCSWRRARRQTCSHRLPSRPRETQRRLDARASRRRLRSVGGARGQRLRRVFRGQRCDRLRPQIPAWGPAATVIPLMFNDAARALRMLRASRSATDSIPRASASSAPPPAAISLRPSSRT